MQPTRVYAAGAVVAIACVTLLFGMALGLPAGVAPSTGSSMGDDGPVLNVWVDAEPDVGDVIIFDTESERFSHDQAAHRVIDETDDGYRTQGDAREFVDQERGAAYATSENTAGVVVARVTVMDIAWLLTITTGFGILLKRNRAKGWSRFIPSPNSESRQRSRNRRQ